VATYSGPILRARNSAGQEQDFFADNQIDTVSLSAFLGGNDGFVASVYDQSGEMNLSQVLPYLPRIAIDGSLVQINNKLAADFGTNRGLRSAGSTLTQGTFTLACVASRTNTFSGYHTFWDSAQPFARSGGLAESGNTSMHFSVYPLGVKRNGVVLASPFDMSPITNPYALEIQHTQPPLGGGIGNYDGGNFGGAVIQGDTIIFASTPSAEAIADFFNYWGINP
jgi:hypothetical protein